MTRSGVVHDQSLGPRGMIKIHFHSGRSYAGFLRNRMDRSAWVRFAGVLIIRLARFAKVITVATRKGYGSTVAQAWPAMLLLLYVQAGGQLIGFLTGPGDSPNRVQ